ncbi:MAG TPA: TraB/GumN family protein [Kofleriaceae bacterium]|nr:TraB/GumN family protein [Kofleriaceae bacterium]
MKLRHGLLVTLVALASAGAACKQARDPAPSPALMPPPPAPAGDPWQGAAHDKDPLPRPFLWTAEKDGVTTYLLGTMHVGIDPEARLPPIVWDRLEASAAFAMETDITDPAIQNIGGRTSGTLRDELGPEYWKKLEAALTPQIAQALVNKSAMIPATLLALRGLPPTPPMDGILLARAMNRGKKIAYLEPAAHQAAMLEKHMNTKALRLMLDELAETEQQTKQLLGAYIAGDEARFVAITDEQRKDALAHGYTAAEYDESMEDLLYRRNASWIAPIEKLHAAGGVFVAVGAMHLIGTRSVLELLGARGFRITRVTPPAPPAAPPAAPTR